MFVLLNAAPTHKHRDFLFLSLFLKKLTDFNEVPFQEDVLGLEVSVEDPPAESQRLLIRSVTSCLTDG